MFSSNTSWMISTLWIGGLRKLEERSTPLFLGTSQSQVDLLLVDGRKGPGEAGAETEGGGGCRLETVVGSWQMPWMELGTEP